MSKKNEKKVSFFFIFVSFPYCFAEEIGNAVVLNKEGYAQYCTIRKTYQIPPSEAS